MGNPVIERIMKIASEDLTSPEISRGGSQGIIPNPHILRIMSLASKNLTAPALVIKKPRLDRGFFIFYFFLRRNAGIAFQSSSSSSLSVSSSVMFGMGAFSSFGRSTSFSCSGSSTSFSLFDSA